MTDSLPERPDLDQLRRRAKELRDAARRGETAALERFARHHPTAGSRPATLAAAQLVIARELGYASWPRLKAAVEARSSVQREVSDFLTASVDGSTRVAVEMLERDPGLAQRDVRAAAVLGEVNAVREALRSNPAAAVITNDERGWPPLLYACSSRWHQLDVDRAPGLSAVVRLLLEGGANPNTNDGGRARYRSALRGSVEVNNPEITELLLDAGAHPDPGQPVAEAVGHPDQRCLQLLLAHGARVERTWAVGAAVAHDNVEGLRLLLSALEAERADVARQATEALPDAVANASASVVAALLDAGADPNVTDDEGLPALRLAVRSGKKDTAILLRDAGATVDVRDVDRLLGACRSGERQTVEDLLSAEPWLPDRLTDQDRSVIVDAASTASAESVRLMLEIGFSPDTRKLGEQPLHAAAYQGNAAVVELLLEAGADVDALDERFEGTPLAFATVGSGEQAGQPGDWVTTVKLLIEAGAPRDGVWLSGKPPSQEVTDLLRHYGIGPTGAAEPEEVEAEDPADDPADSAAEVAGAPGAGIMADMARHLEAAHRDLDVELLGSLLHPDVTWTGQCRSKTQVLDWYRYLLVDGNEAAVKSVEVDRDAVILGLDVTRRAEGARPAPPQRRYMVFTVADAQIVDVNGYPDRVSALARTRPV